MPRADEMAQLNERQYGGSYSPTSNPIYGPTSIGDIESIPKASRSTYSPGVTQYGSVPTTTAYISSTTKYSDAGVATASSSSMTVTRSSVFSSSSVTMSSSILPSSSSSRPAAVQDNSKSSSGGFGKIGMYGMVGGLLGLGLVITFIALTTILCRRKKKRRIRVSQRIAEGPSMSEIQIQGQQRGRDLFRGRPFEGDLTAEEAQDVVSIPSRTYQTTMPLTSAGHGTLPPRLPPRPVRHLPHHDSSRSIQPGVGSSRGQRFSMAATSRWGSDDSEYDYDMVATDGSSITRTLSTRSDITVTDERRSIISENPFDHPAYTARPHRLQTNTGTLGTLGTSTLSPFSPVSPISPITVSGSSGPTGTFQSLRTPLPSSHDHQLQSIYTPNSSNHHSRPPSSIISDQSGHTAEDEAYHYGFMPPSPALRRGTTIIRHADSQSAASPTVEGTRHQNGVNSGRRTKEVHLPPTYGEVYGDLS